MHRSQLGPHTPLTLQDEFHSLPQDTPTAFHHTANLMVMVCFFGREEAIIHEQTAAVSVTSTPRKHCGIKKTNRDGNAIDWPCYGQRCFLVCCRHHHCRGERDLSKKAHQVFGNNSAAYGFP
ncbi:hypothetical protein MRX96_043494 [Rhipicephalus microplus]